MSPLRMVAGAIALSAIGVGTVIACGPFFPNQYLPSRSWVLVAGPDAGFSRSVRRLWAGPIEPIEAVEDVSCVGIDDITYARRIDPDCGANARRAAEARDLLPNQSADVEAMRRSDSGQAALALHVDLTASVRLYTAGAVDFLRGAYREAAGHFQAVLDLPSADGAPRAVWAAFMLGRIAVAQDNAEDAARHFAHARELAAGGAPDPLGLAVSGLGEEARLHLRRALRPFEPDFFRSSSDVEDRCIDALVAADRAAGMSRDQLQSRRYYNDTRCDASKSTYDAMVLRQQRALDANPGLADGFATDIPKAIELYARQSAHRSQSGRASLLAISRMIQRHDALAAALGRSRTGVRFMLAMTFDDDMPDKGPFVRTIRSALDQTPIDDQLGAELALAAYRLGEFDKAQKLVDAVRSPLADWIGAKLAVRRGDPINAVARLDATLAHPPEAWRALAFGAPDQTRIVAERAMFAVGSGEFAHALQMLYTAQGNSDKDGLDDEGPAWRDPDTEQTLPLFWGDIVHVAENLIALDAFVAFVEARRAVGDLHPRLGDLLARRLFRAGRHQEALGYYQFDETRAHAAEVAAQLRVARDAANPTQRAAALFAAAKIQRAKGMDIVGYEGPSDYSYNRGDYTSGIGSQSLTLDCDLYGAELDYQFACPYGPPPDYMWRRPQLPFLVSDAETEFFARLPIERPFRFHYRYAAAEAAMQAADLLPARSQAFAAVLCEANRWMQRTNHADAQKVAARIYARYLREGAYVPWGKEFGRTCPAPDFAAAEEMRRWQTWRAIRSWASRNRNAFGGIALAVLAGLIFWVAGRTGRRVA